MRFFDAVAMFILLYICTTTTLTTHIEKKNVIGTTEEWYVLS